MSCFKRAVTDTSVFRPSAAQMPRNRAAEILGCIIRPSIKLTKQLPKSDEVPDWPLPHHSKKTPPHAASGSSAGGWIVLYKSPSGPPNAGGGTGPDGQHQGTSVRRYIAKLR